MSFRASLSHSELRRPRDLTDLEIIYSFGNGRQLDGIIYMQSIVENTRQSVKSMQRLKRFCQTGGYEHVVIATTDWEMVSDPVGGADKAKLRFQETFKSALDTGARIVSHDGGMATALSILLDIAWNIDLQKVFDEPDEGGVTEAVDLRIPIAALLSKYRKEMQQVVEIVRGSDGAPTARIPGDEALGSSL